MVTAAINLVLEVRSGTEYKHVAQLVVIYIWALGSAWVDVQLFKGRSRVEEEICFLFLGYGTIPYAEILTGKK